MVSRERTEIAGFVILTLAFCKLRRGKSWIGRCLETGTADYDKSIDSVTEGVSSLTALLISTVDGVNQRELYFREKGITFHTELPGTYEPTLPINKKAQYYRALVLANAPGQEENWFIFNPKS